MYIGLHVKYPLFLSDINETFYILDRLSKNIDIQNFMKIRAIREDLFHTDGQMNSRAEGHDEANICSSQFCEST